MAAIFLVDQDTVKNSEKVYTKEPFKLKMK